MVVGEHPIGVRHLFELVDIAVGLLEGVAAEHTDVLLEEVAVLVGLALALRPLDLEAEDAGVLGEDVALQEGEVDVLGRLYNGLIVFVPDVVAAAEELLLLVGRRDDDGCGSCVVEGVPMISSEGILVKSGGLETVENCMTPGLRLSISKHSMTWSKSELLGDPM